MEKNYENYRFESIKSDSRNYASSINLNCRDSAKASSYLPTLSPQKGGRKFRLDKKLTSKSIGSFENFSPVNKQLTPNDSNCPSPDNRNSDSVRFESRFEPGADQALNYEEDRHSDFTIGLKQSILKVAAVQTGCTSRQAFQGIRTGQSLQVLLVQR